MMVTRDEMTKDIIASTARLQQLQEQLDEVRGRSRKLQEENWELYNTFSELSMYFLFVLFLLTDWLTDWLEIRQFETERRSRRRRRTVEIEKGNTATCVPSDNIGIRSELGKKWRTSWVYVVSWKWIIWFQFAFWNEVLNIISGRGIEVNEWKKQKQVQVWWGGYDVILK